MLPFARGDYEQDFAAGAPRDEFHALLAQAQSVLELPGKRDAPLAAYVMAGRATVAHCDMLIAIWDGEPPRGRGGTGEVVEIALLEGTPILHVPIDPAAPRALAVERVRPARLHHARKLPCRRRALQRRRARAACSARSCCPPPTRASAASSSIIIASASGGSTCGSNIRLLLALTGVGRLGRTSVRPTPMRQALESEWQTFRDACSEGHGVATAIDPLQRAYCWSDQLARHFAQTYRSGHIFNFLVGAAAVLIALAGLVLPQGKLLLATAELAMIAAVIVNTQVGVRHGWHRRWLDYRQLAERLRPMRSLKLLGVAAPRRDPHARLDERRWTEWYAAGHVARDGLPDGRDPRSRAARGGADRA